MPQYAQGLILEEDGFSAVQLYTSGIRFWLFLFLLV